MIPQFWFKKTNQHTHCVGQRARRAHSSISRVCHVDCCIRTHWSPRASYPSRPSPSCPPAQSAQKVAAQRRGQPNSNHQPIGGRRIQRQQQRQRQPLWMLHWEAIKICDTNFKTEGSWKKIARTKSLKLRTSGPTPVKWLIICSMQLLCNNAKTDQSRNINESASQNLFVDSHPPKPDHCAMTHLCMLGKSCHSVTMKLPIRVGKMN